LEYRGLLSTSEIALIFFHAKEHWEDMGCETLICSYFHGALTDNSRFPKLSC